MKRVLKLSPFVSLTPWLGSGKLVGFNVGPDNCIYLAIAQKPLDERHQINGASFAKSVPDQPNSYRVVALREGKPVLDTTIENERFNIHDIQPLKEELLLVCGRSVYRSPTDFEKNGRIYSRDGKFAREILLGDGIQNVQTTPAGLIWTSFFDEGIFGNRGWSNPIGQSGLVAWDVNGSRVYEFQPTADLDSICDCYALNVASEEDIWFYYYTQFALVWLKRGIVKAFWNSPVEGSSAFAITNNHVLFRGGYEERDSFELYSLDYNGPMELAAKLELRDVNGCLLKFQRALGRGSTLYLLSGDAVYCVDVNDAL